MNTLTIKDETASGKLLHEIALRFNQEYITVKELIAARIENEVERYANDLSNYRKGLIQPSDLEQRLNNKKLNKVKVDVEKQTYIALDAFNKNAFFILIDNEQVESLDQKFLVDETAKISFIKLTPLVGG